MKIVNLRSLDAGQFQEYKKQVKGGKFYDTGRIFLYGGKLDRKEQHFFVNMNLFERIADIFTFGLYAKAKIKAELKIKNFKTIHKMSDRVLDAMEKKTKKVAKKELAATKSKVKISTRIIDRKRDFTEGQAAAYEARIEKIKGALKHAQQMDLIGVKKAFGFIDPTGDPTGFPFFNMGDFVALDQVLTQANPALLDEFLSDDEISRAIVNTMNDGKITKDDLSILKNLLIRDDLQGNSILMKVMHNFYKGEKTGKTH